jgi:tRNA (guanine37-N1)-methyltransferase
MLFRLFTLHPDIFGGFINNSLIARGIANKVIDIQTLNWREDFGIGNYKQVDDKPFGGGSGMVLMADPILKAMESVGATTLKTHPKQDIHASYLPNNSKFWEAVKNGTIQNKKVNILMTPRGFPFNQQVAEWVAESFEEVNILCGRYEGFDARVNDSIDLELSMGNFVLNGGEVGAMCLIEAVSRLVPDFITKNTSVLHDSFSSGLNDYSEFEFSNSKQPVSKKKLLEKQKLDQQKLDAKNKNLFDDNWWIDNVLPYIEHPQYTRPEVYNNQKIPEVLLSGNHKKIQEWRKKWYTQTHTN